MGKQESNLRSNFHKIDRALGYLKDKASHWSFNKQGKLPPNAHPVDPSDPKKVLVYTSNFKASVDILPTGECDLYVNNAKVLRCQNEAEATEAVLKVLEILKHNK